MEWRVKTKSDNVCAKQSYWDPDFMVCMDKTLPQADVGIFKVSDSSNIENVAIQDLHKFMEFVSFEKEYASKKPHDFGTSYLSPCLGDSGSGHWITVNDDQTEAWKGVKMKQMALVAVYTTGLTGRYKLNRNYETGVCGGDVYLENGKRLVGENFCTKTTNEQVLDFLKLNTDVCNLDDQSKCCKMC